MIDARDRGTPIDFDHVIVTASDERQAAGYRLQLEMRRRAGSLPERTGFHVVPDPLGRRVGSGGSTFLALGCLASVAGDGVPLGAALAGRRVLILHAGGASTRLPAYAALGKLFVPLPFRSPGRRHAALFDLSLDRLVRLPRPPGGHVVLAAGDVLLTHDPAALDLDRPGVTSVVYADGLERAARHGVYFLEPSGRVTSTLQKPSPAELRAHGAPGGDGRVLIDTGLLSLAPAAVEAFGAAAGLADGADEDGGRPSLLAELRSGVAAPIDLYSELIPALIRNMTPDDFERRVLSRPCQPHPRRRAQLLHLYHRLRAVEFHAEVLPECDFYHPGTSGELFDGLVNGSRTGELYGFRRVARSSVPIDWPQDRACVLDSVVEPGRVVCGPGVLLEGVHVRADLRLEGRNIVTSLPGEVRRPIHLPWGIGLTLLPVGEAGQWAAVLYGVDDGSSEAGRDWFLGVAIEAFLRDHGVDPRWVWPDHETEHSAYRARFWPVGAPDEVISLTSWMTSPAADPAAIGAWRARERRSLEELVRDADHGRLLAHGVELRRLASIGRLWETVVEGGGRDLQGCCGMIRSRSEAAIALDGLSPALSGSGPLARARALALAAAVHRHAESLPDDDAAQCRIEHACEALTGEDAGPEALDRAVDSAVAGMVALHAPRPPRPAAATVGGVRGAWATAPARLDFAGGWTDTPPICMERGGAVVNAAVDIEGGPPIRVLARWNGEGVVRILGRDRGLSVCLRRPDELLDHSDPREWSSLPRACLLLSGLAEAGDGGRRWFDSGLDLAFSSAVPHGSGLGVSSILAAAILSCLTRLTGEALGRDDLIRRTLQLEQRLTTGGGWQDQVGGVLPGVKLTRTRPGFDQTPSIAPLAVDDVFGRKLVLYYTGLQRLAKDILRNVVHAYLVGEPRVHRALDRLEEGAAQTASCLRRRDYGAFGEELLRYWELKAQMDPGVTNSRIEALIDRARPYCSGWCLLGAGGGGYLLLVPRREEAVGPLRAALTPGPAGARFVDFTIARNGLEVGAD